MSEAVRNSLELHYPCPAGQATGKMTTDGDFEVSFDVSALRPRYGCLHIRSLPSIAAYGERPRMVLFEEPDSQYCCPEEALRFGLRLMRENHGVMRRDFA